MKRQWLEDNPFEIIQCGEQRKRKSGIKQILSDLQGYIKRSNIYRVLENERQNWVNPKSEERMGKILQIKKIQGILHSTTRKKKKSTLEMWKTILKASRGKKHTIYNETKYKVPVTSQQKGWRPEYNDTASLKCQMKTNLQPRILSVAKITLRDKGEIKHF